MNKRVGKFDDRIEEFRQSAVVDDESEIFFFYSPSKTFSSENIHSNVLDHNGEVVKSLEFFEGDEQPVSIGDYFDKGKQCVDVLVSLAAEVNHQIEIDTHLEELLLSAFSQMAGYAHFLADEMQNKRRNEFLNAETKEAFDLVAYVKGHKYLDVKSEFMFTVSSSKDINPFGRALFAFSALQYLDDIVLSELSHPDDFGTLSATSQFHNNYFKAIKLEQIEQETRRSLEKQRTQNASKRRVDLTRMRDQFVIKEWEKSGLSAKEFAYDPAHLKAINDFSQKIGKSPLTMHGGGETIYRLLLGYRKGRS